MPEAGGASSVAMAVEAGGHYTDDVQFPPLPADVRSATPVVPFVIVEETGETSVQVPVAGKQVGDQIPLNAKLNFGSYPLGVTSAEIINRRGECRLLLHLDPGDWHDGRKLVSPGQVFVNGSGVAFQFGNEGDVGQATQLSMALPTGAGTLTITLMYPNVGVQGPWRLPVRVPTRR